MTNIAGTIKSIRDIFRKDPGLSGDAQHINHLLKAPLPQAFEKKETDLAKAD